MVLCVYSVNLKWWLSETETQKWVCVYFGVNMMVMTTVNENVWRSKETETKMSDGSQRRMNNAKRKGVIGI